jgi:hypothetical protein
MKNACPLKMGVQQTSISCESKKIFSPLPFFFGGKLRIEFFGTPSSKLET